MGWCRCICTPAVTTETEQYKYLVQEYVSFKLQTMEGGDQEYQANDVRGVNGGKLMCETRKRIVRHQVRVMMIY